jgi:hypothetical protein
MDRGEGRRESADRCLDVNQSVIRPWVGGLLLGVSDHILGLVRLGHTANCSMSW